MTQLITQFIIIWEKNANMLSVQANEIDKYFNIIQKLRRNTRLETPDKLTFIELIELMADTIYFLENCPDKYGIDYYQQTKKYQETELNVCSSLLVDLQSQICYDVENNYDIAFAKSCEHI